MHTYTHEKPWQSQTPTIMLINKNRKHTHIQSNNGHRIWHRRIRSEFNGCFVFLRGGFTRIHVHFKLAYLSVDLAVYLPSPVSWTLSLWSMLCYQIPSHRNMRVCARVSLMIVLLHAHICVAKNEQCVCVSVCVCRFIRRIHFNFSGMRFIIDRRNIWTFYVHKFPVNFGHFTSKT